MIEKRSAARGLQRFAYDAESRLVEVHNANGSVVRMTYDPLGRRVEKTEHDNDGYRLGVTRFTWDGLRLLQEHKHSQTSLYVYEEEGSEPLARVDGVSPSQKIRYYHNDLNGLPERLTEADGRDTWRATYTVWGNTVEEVREPYYIEEQNLRLQGQYLDRETGLHFNTFRFYDPDIGRFTTPDPIGLLGGQNLYVYAPNPIAWIDPEGLKCHLRPYFKAYARMKKFRGRLKMEVHHRIPQMYIGVKKLFPESMRTSLSNLQGLPRNVHRKIVSPMWASFRKTNPKPTRAQIVKKAMEIDKVIAEHINKVN